MEEGLKRVNETINSWETAYWGMKSMGELELFHHKAQYNQI